MMGKHECRQAHHTDLKGAIYIGLDEALTALEESVYDLNDEHIWAFPLPGENNIAWILMHSLQNLDEYADLAQGGEAVFAHEGRWDLWQCADDERPVPGDAFPTQRECVDILAGVRAAAMERISAATRKDLRREFPDWQNRTRADAYMRTIFHTMSHIRQIWLLRGVMGLTGGKLLPQQHWA